MVLKKKSEITKFQILVETAASQPQIKQREIAASLGITPQAVSEYVKELISDGLIRSSGRGLYKVTPKGVETITNDAREFQEYSTYVLNYVVGQVGVWPAIATSTVKKGDEVMLTMKNGITYAGPGHEGACGTAICDALEGEDVGVRDLKGLIPLKKESLKLVKVPPIESGGSRHVDAARLRGELCGLVGVTGIEALAALQKIGACPDVSFGAVDVLVDAAIRGVKGTLVITADLAPQAVHKLETAGVSYMVVELGSKQ
jgi:putative transcriptional regulator